MPAMVPAGPQRGEMTMGFRRSDLQEAIFVPGDRGFRAPGF
jgi:hypothetical protein